MIVIMRDAVMPECCKTCICSEGYGCGITGTEMTTKEMESRPDWCPLEEVEPCEDVVSRHKLLNDLEELTTAWEKYPVMAEQIKGVEAAIGYVKLIPSVTPKEQKWIPVSERLPDKNCRCLTTNDAWGAFEVDLNAWIDGQWLYPNDEPVAWMPLPKPYSERLEE